MKDMGERCEIIGRDRSSFRWFPTPVVGTNTTRSNVYTVAYMERWREECVEFCGSDGVFSAFVGVR